MAIVYRVMCVERTFSKKVVDVGGQPFGTKEAAELAMEALRPLHLDTPLMVFPIHASDVVVKAVFSGDRK
jgi:hypothetical protein